MSAQPDQRFIPLPTCLNCESGPAALRVGTMVCVCLVGLPQQGSTQDSLPVLLPGRPVEGVFATRPPAYRLSLLAGQFLRVVGEGPGFLRLLGPRGDTILIAHSPMFSHAVQVSGPYRLEIAPYPGEDSSSQRYELRVEELLSPAQHAARQDSLRSDPRVGWIARHAISLRSLSFDDEDFSDLRGLREAIGEARIVLLGEESHASATTIRAMSRLARFLHQEMGFDVLAFESGLYDMWKVWQFVQAGHDPVNAMQQGLIGTWSRAAAFQSLANHVGQRAVGPHPLEVAGVDMQIGTLSRQQLVPELKEVVAREHLGEEGKDLVQGFWSALSGFVGAPPGCCGTSAAGPDSLATRRAQEDVLSDLRWLAERLADAGETRSAADGRTLRMWAQVSRSLAEFMGSLWSDARNAYGDRRDHQMARNLAWLAREYFPGRKIIVWAHNRHVLRHPNRLPADPADPLQEGGPTWLGQGAWEAFGDRSFVIAATAYGGQFRWGNQPPSMPSFTVMADQDPSFELEELLAATGLEQAVLPLRNLPPGGEWLRNRSLSRLSSVAYRAGLATWPDHADAILFMREATPRIRAPVR